MNIIKNVCISLLMVTLSVIILFIFIITIQSPSENLRDLISRAEKGDIQAQRFLAEQYDPKLHRPQRNRLFGSKNHELSQYWYKKLCDGNDNDACRKLDANVQVSPKPSKIGSLVR